MIFLYRTHVTYIIPNVINAGGSFVDLLWGTKNNTDVNVLGNGNSGVTGDGTSLASEKTYTKAILGTNSVNADLTKQKVTGKVGFLFKHALAKIGGGTTVDGTTEPTTGFLVKLDIDNGSAATGGVREKFKIGEASEDNAWRTIVTVKDITITNDLNGDSEGLGDGAQPLYTKGTLNLATGQWTRDTETGTGEFTQSIGTAYSSNTPNAELNSKIAEMYKDSEGSDAGKTVISKHTSTITDYFAFTNTEDVTKNHPGVTENAQSVYNDATQTPIILIPGVTPKFKITIDYIVRTYDASLASTKPYTEVEQKITKTITFGQAVELNKHYSILMHLGLTGVKFTATVADWTPNDGDNDNTDGEAEDAEQVHLPINVSD